MKCLLIIDIQNDFLPGGALAVTGGDEIIPIVNRIMPDYNLVVATQDWHPEGHGSFAASHEGVAEYDVGMLGDLEQCFWPTHCVQGTKGAEFAPSLNTAGIDEVVRKGQDVRIDSYSGFYDNGGKQSTGLTELLRSHGVTEVHLVGLALDYCVKFTALDAVKEGFKTYLIPEATRAVNIHPDDAENAIQEMKDAGVEVREMKQPTKQDRFQACLLGLAAGDALGTTLEFMPPGSFEPIDDIVGGGPFSLRAGQWTDDTSMALCLADSLIRKKKFDAEDQMKRYCKWWKQGYFSVNGVCFDIGNTVSGALQKFLVTGNPYAGSTDKWSAGNGSIMRLAPVVMAYAEHPETAIEMAARSSTLTHGATEAVDACRYMAAILCGAFQGATKDELLDYYQPVPRLWNSEPLIASIEAIAKGSFKEKEPPEIRGTGYVVDSLEAALWAFYKTDNFRDGALLAVNLGDDADTTGAVYGQIAGAFYGEIPDDWSQKIWDKDIIESMANKLYQR